MRLRSFGYVGQNLSLGLATGRTLRLANLANEARLAEVIAANLAGLEAILDWNVDLALAVLAEVGGDRPVDFMLEAKAKEAAALRHAARLGRP